MAHAQLEEMLERWERGDCVAELLLEQWRPCDLASVDEKDDNALEALAGSLLDGVRRLCLACTSASAASARVFAGVLASLAGNLGVPSAFARPLLTRTLRHASIQGFPLHDELMAACKAMLGRYASFLAGMAQLKSSRFLPALPFDIALAAAHCCSIMNCVSHQDRELASQLRDLAKFQILPALLGPNAQAADSQAFVGVAVAVKRRAAELCFSLAGQQGAAAIDLVDELRAAAREGLASLSAVELIPSSSSSPSSGLGYSENSLALGDDIEADPSGKGLESARIVLLEKGQAVIRCEHTGKYAYVAVDSLFPPGSSEALVHHRAALGLAQNATIDEAKAAYRRLVRTLHPDKGGDSKAFQQVQAAFEALRGSAAAAASDSFEDFEPAFSTPRRSGTRKASRTYSSVSPLTPEARTPRRVRLRSKTPQQAAWAGWEPKAATSKPGGRRRLVRCGAPKRRSQRLRGPPARGEPGASKDIPAHEHSVNGIMQLIWAFAF